GADDGARGADPGEQRPEPGAGGAGGRAPHLPVPGTGSADAAAHLAELSAVGAGRAVCAGAGGAGGGGRGGRGGGGGAGGAVVAAAVGVEHAAPTYFVLAAAVMAIKALAIPWFLDHTAARVGVRRDMGAVLPPTLALLAAIGALGAGYFLAPRVAPLHATSP